ncbi:MAG: methyltransferase domain-containing protein [Chloroflexi bacterium]|nr:methyltransferase domain-containing protein [Chloroflexota bacterium]
MQDLKRGLRDSFVRPLYLWLANRYRGLRRLFAYPDTAHVGMVDYDVYWDAKAEKSMGSMSPWRRRRSEVFARLVERGETVLDLGVGDGALLEFIIQQRGVLGYGLDISPKAVAFCQTRGLNVQLGDINRPVADVLADSFPGVAFDWVILSEIIEHLPDPESLLQSLQPLARKGIIVSIPNTGFHQHRLRLLLGRFPLQWVVTPGEHLRYWTRADFHWWARQLGFVVAREVPYEGTPYLKNLLPGLFAAAFVFALHDGQRLGEGHGSVRHLRSVQS